MSWITARQFSREIALKLQSTCPPLAAKLLLAAAAVTALFLASSPAYAQTATNGNKVLATPDLVSGTASLGWDPLSPIPPSGVAGPAQALAVGYFNADGIPDLVVATAGSNGQQGDVSILLGNGDGTFASAINVPALVLNAGIAVGNFVEGGPLDVVSADNESSSNNVCLTITDGTGHMASQTSFSVPNFTGGIAVGPGSSSMAFITGPEPGGVVIFKSNGNGTFAAPTTVALPFPPTGIVATRYGFAITNSANDSMTTVDGSTFDKATYPTGSGPTGIATGSFTSTGGADLIIADNGDNTVAVLFDNGNGTYSAPTFLPVEPGPCGVVVGDFNGDGKADFAVTSQTANTVSIFLGNGDGTFSAPQIIAVGNGPQSIAAGLFTSGTNAGKFEMAMVNTTDGSISNLLLGASAVTTSLAVSPSSIPLGSSSKLSLTATVTESGPNPTGTVTFKVGATTVGSAAVSNGSATWSGMPTTANGFTVGSGSIMACYSPTTGTGSVASSGTEYLTVTAPAYTISPSTTAVSLSQGGSQNVTVTLASTTFADTTSWTATTSSPLITVSPTSGTATLAANGSSTVNLKISASSS